MKKPVITMGLTNNIAFAAGTVLLGLKEHKPNRPHDLIIYETDLTESNKKLLHKIYPCIFKKFDTSKIASDKFIRISKMAFARYENFSLLKDYSTVVWLDTDILIKEDISFLLQTFPSGIAMYKHSGTPLKDGLKGNIDTTYDLEEDSFASGSLVVSDTLKNPEILKNWCYQKTNKWADKISGDMQIINLMLQEFNIDPYELEEKYCCYPTKEKTDTIIIHPWWRKKFWNNTINPQWDYYYKKWKKLGGEGPKLPHPIKRFIKYHIWKMINKK